MDLKKQFGDWYPILKDVIESDYFQGIPKQLGKNYNPSKENIFKAFRLCQLKDLRVIILGQNPYPDKRHATGLAFGIAHDAYDIPPSLQNISKELESDLFDGAPYFTFDHTLENWAKQGVLLLNTALTTSTNVSANVHKQLWDPFIKKVFQAMQEKHTGLVFILWGNDAKSYKPLINKHQYIIESAHPSPLSAYKGFFGTKPFSKTNTILKSINNYQIIW